MRRKDAYDFSVRGCGQWIINKPGQAASAVRPRPRPKGQQHHEAIELVVSRGGAHVHETIRTRKTCNDGQMSCQSLSDWWGDNRPRNQPTIQHSANVELAVDSYIGNDLVDVSGLGKPRRCHTLGSD